MIKQLQRNVLGSTGVALAGLLVFAATAFAAPPPPRVPQIPFFSGPLQGYLNLVDNSINVTTDQLNAQTWSTSITGNTDFTLMLETGAGVASSIGVYNGADPNPIPALFQIFPAGAAANWYAACHFGGGSLTVSLFDNANVFQGQTIYAGVSASNFAFYIQTPGGALWFGQDARNGGPQALTYASNDTPGDYWECFEALPYAAASSTFNGVILNLQSVKPTPTHGTTWGKIKASYR